jgi:hypothetical protein
VKVFSYEKSGLSEGIIFANENYTDRKEQDKEKEYSDLIRCKVCWSKRRDKINNDS